MGGDTVFGIQRGSLVELTGTYDGKRLYHVFTNKLVAVINDCASKVRQAYHTILCREPDTLGLTDYRQQCEKGNKSQADIEDDMRSSEEYKECWKCKADGCRALG